MKFTLQIDTTDALWPDGTKNLDGRLRELGEVERLGLAREVLQRALASFGIALVEIKTPANTTGGGNRTYDGSEYTGVSWQVK